jgi:predicted dehydrogenase
MTFPTIGMIGYGGIGRVHGMAYRSLPFHYGLPADTVRIGGVATTRAETAQAAAAELGCGFWTADYRELLARPEIDAVDICVPNHMHAEIAEAAAAAGKHIYCEKPLAMNVAEARRMVDAAARAGVKTQMTFNFRYYPAVLRARQLVDEGLLGRIFSFRGRYYRSSYIDPNKPISWRQQRPIAGGGALFDIGSHILDMLYYACVGEFSAVQATLDTLIKERPAAHWHGRTCHRGCGRHRPAHAAHEGGRAGRGRCLAHGHGADQRHRLRDFRREGRDPRLAVSTRPGWRSTTCATPTSPPAGCAASASSRPSTATPARRRPTGR